VARPKSQDLEAYTPPYRLLEEARKSWDHTISDEIVYGLDSGKVALDSPISIAKDYLEGNIWIECHMTFNGRFQGEGDIHYAAILKACETDDALRQGELKNRTVHRDSHVFVNVAHLIETPEEMAFRFPSVIWLKRFDNRQCLCGYPGSSSLESLRVGSFENRELRISGISSLELCETPYKLVQRRPEAVKNVSDNERDSVGRVFVLDANATPLVFNIILGVETARLVFVKSVQTLPQILKVFFRPRCLQIGVSQIHESRL